MNYDIKFSCLPWHQELQADHLDQVLQVHQHLHRAHYQVHQVHQRVLDLQEFRLRRDLPKM